MKDQGYNSLDLSYKAIGLSFIYHVIWKREQWLLKLPQPLNKLAFEQSKILRLRPENMEEVIIRLIPKDLTLKLLFYGVMTQKC